jgi:predicted dehydrogenase
MDKIGVGVVGCGFVGRGAHVPALKTIECAHLAAIADPDEKRRTKAATKYDVPGAYEDYQQLIDDPDVQAVIVSVPTHLHAEVSLAAIKAGKHVLCEMPLAANLEEADEVIAAANEAGVYLMPSLTFRFTPNYVKAKQMIQDGVLGAPTAMLYRELIPAKDLAKQWPPGCWVWDVEETGGPLFTLSVWSLDLMRWLNDAEIVEVHPVTKYTPLEQFGGTLGYDSFCNLRLSNGVVACIEYSGSVASSVSSSLLEVIGDSTSVLRATDNDRVILVGEDPEKTEWNVKEPGPRMWGHEQQDEHFVRSILDGTAPCIAPEDGRKAMEVALQIGRAT